MMTVGGCLVVEECEAPVGGACALHPSRQPEAQDRLTPTLPAERFRRRRTKGCQECLPKAGEAGIVRLLDAMVAHRTEGVSRVGVDRQ